MIKIIHISDFHLESENPPNEKIKLVSALAKDIKKYVDKNTILAFTGDMINKGGIDFKTDKSQIFAEFEKILLTPILSENPILTNRIFVVPGNHDIARDKIDSISETGLADTLISIKSTNEFIKSNRIKSKHLDQLEDYKNWEHQFYSKYSNATLSNFENTFIVSLEDYNVGVTCLNSSWLCRKKADDKENLIIGKCQIENSLETIKNCDIKLALSHHPIEFLKEFDRDSVKIELFKNYNILFTGHVHELSSSYTQDLYGDIFISIANSTIADNPIETKYSNGYTIIELYPTEKIKATYRKYVQQHDNFVPNTDIGTEDASKEFSILKNEVLERFYNLSYLVGKIENQHAEKLNEHIIMSSNNTNVICTIDSLFVEPRIYNCSENTFKQEDIKEYSVDSIIESDSNFLIYGQKESGKTILLDRLFLESIKRFNHFGKIPVIIRFNDFKEKELSKVIREFLGVSSQEFTKIFTENKVILFIDEINFSAKYTPQIKELESFITKYNKTQVVCTKTQIIEGVMPIDYLDHNDIFNFEVGFIQSLNSKEIKSLILKWFKGKDVDFQNDIEKLLKNFADFGLPKTPLSVTLFLWIFEKQEKRPINNSVLVELFIENLLEKTNIENIYSETFDFKNKQRLLAFISKFMRDKGNPDLDYCVDYVELLTEVNNYLKTRFTGKPQKVLDDFIKRGILTFEGSNLVRFKSDFFFHYFLALYIDYDPAFKAEIFTEEKYLSYSEEIVYYTGLKRDDVSVLKFTQLKLSEAFNDYNKSVVENAKKIDEVLEKSKSNTISFQVDGDKYKHKLSEKQIEQMYDNQLSNTPVTKNIPNKNIEVFNTKKDFDRVLKLASSVLKNSEDVDDFDEKTSAYKNILTSSIAFMLKYRDNLISYYAKHNQKPANFPKNIDFNLFVHVLPLIHQVMLYEWLGSQKLRPVFLDKIEKDKLELNISDFEKFITIFIYSDIRGSQYPELIENFVKKTELNYTKDLAFIKVLSYYHLRSKDAELDKFYIKLMADIKVSLGNIDKRGKSDFINKIEEKRKRGN